VGVPKITGVGESSVFEALCANEGLVPGLFLSRVPLGPDGRAIHAEGVVFSGILRQRCGDRIVLAFGGFTLFGVQRKRELLFFLTPVTAALDFWQQLFRGFPAARARHSVHSQRPST
jgi:hypothetical protein